MAPALPAAVELARAVRGPLRVGGGRLRLRIDADQPPWCPELDGDVNVSSLQTGLFAGPLGSTIGQRRFSDDAVVREEQANVRLYTPAYGLIEMRAARRSTTRATWSRSG